VTLAATLALAISGGAPPGALGATVTTSASLTDIENDVMCVACHESLAISQSPQANAERNFIRGLIAQGETKAQIERRLVAEYGPAVLARPPAHGFNLTVYILPPALVIAGLATLAVALPRWRRRTRAPLAAGPVLSAADARRLDEDLARHDR
jgi:cytochrome c-type biogenesis protein CcmH